MSLPSGGIVRPARRPLDWSAPGPRPPEAREETALWPQAGEDLCFLSGDFRILQRTGGHRWSLDDLVTAWLAAEVRRDSPPDRFADLGCGIGSVLMILAWRFPAAHGIGVEAQSASVSLARRSLRWNGITDRCEVRLADLRDPAALPEGEAFDLVTGTPPYFASSRAHASADAQRHACRVELRGGVAEYCRAAARLLRPGARFVLCGRAEPSELAAAAREASLLVERSLAVVPREGKVALFSVCALARASDAPARREDETLVVRDERGAWTDEFRAVRAAMGMPPRPSRGSYAAPPARGLDGR